MCTGVELFAIGAALSVATTAASMAYQSEQASQMQAYQNRLAQQRDEQIAANYKLAIESYKQQSGQLQQRLSQTGEAAANKEREVALDAARARATARVGAGEAGVAGVSVDALLADFFRQEASFRDASRRNLELEKAQTEEEMKGLRATAEGRVQSIQRYIPEPVSRPNFLGAALRIGGDLAGSYLRLSTKNPQTGRYEL